jgi:hypothetical protein
LFPERFLNWSWRKRQCSTMIWVLSLPQANSLIRTGSSSTMIWVLSLVLD